MENEGRDDVGGEGFGEKLSVWIRTAAAVLGLGFGGFGGYSVFVSDNQAGSAALIVSSLVFMLIGLQGTPLIRMGSGNNSLELDRVRDVARKAAEYAQEEGPPEVAEAVAQVARSIEYRYASPSHRPEIEFEEKVFESLKRLLPKEDVLGRGGPGGNGVDLEIATEGRRVGVDVTYRTRGAFGLRDLEWEGLKVKNLGFDRVILVTNAALSSDVVDANAENGYGGISEVITWNDERDDANLMRALRRKH